MNVRLASIQFHLRCVADCCFGDLDHLLIKNRKGDIGCYWMLALKYIISQVQLESSTEESVGRGLSAMYVLSRSSCSFDGSHLFVQLQYRARGY